MTTHNKTNNSTILSNIRYIFNFFHHPKKCHSFVSNQISTKVHILHLVVVSLESPLIQQSPPTPFFDDTDFFSSVQFSHSVMSDSLQPHGLQHARLPCPSSTPRAYSNSCPSSQWCHPTISSSVVPFSSHLQSFPASGSFLVSQFFPSGGQSIGVSASASVLTMNTQDWFPLG